MNNKSRLEIIKEMFPTEIVKEYGDNFKFSITGKENKVCWFFNSDELDKVLLEDVCENIKNNLIDHKKIVIENVVFYVFIFRNFVSNIYNTTKDLTFVKIYEIVEDLLKKLSLKEIIDYYFRLLIKLETVPVTELIRISENDVEKRMGIFLNYGKIENEPVNQSYLREFGIILRDTGFHSVDN